MFILFTFQRKSFLLHFMNLHVCIMASSWLVKCRWKLSEHVTFIENTSYSQMYYTFILSALQAFSIWAQDVSFDFFISLLELEWNSIIYLSHNVVSKSCQIRHIEYLISMNLCSRWLVNIKACYSLSIKIVIYEKAWFTMHYKL